MKPDQELCICFHVTLRKVLNYIQVERPQRASQLSECFGAGTGCGWCRPFLLRAYLGRHLPAAEQYREMRDEYLIERGQDGDAAHEA